MKTSETLEITISSKAASVLRDMASRSNMTTGEVVEHLAVKMSPTDPVLASLLVVQTTLMILSQLDAENHKKATEYISYSVLSNCPPETLDKLVAEVKQLQEKVIETIDTIPEAIKAELTQRLSLNGIAGA